MGKTNSKLEFLYFVVSALKSRLTCEKKSEKYQLCVSILKDTFLVKNRLNLDLGCECQRKSDSTNQL